MSARDQQRTSLFLYFHRINRRDLFGFIYVQIFGKGIAAADGIRFGIQTPLIESKNTSEHKKSEQAYTYLFPTTTPHYIKINFCFANIE